tara:strand:+ start:3370 stop:3573 length:204 start_codon:yes stop_codon:yes gene_type:complete
MTTIEVPTHKSSALISFDGGDATTTGSARDGGNADGSGNVMAGGLAQNVDIDTIETTESSRLTVETG